MPGPGRGLAFSVTPCLRGLRRAGRRRRLRLRGSI